MARAPFVESLAGGDTLIAVTVAMGLKRRYGAVHPGRLGGMLTPSLATGASIALLVESFGGCASVSTLALIGGAAVLGITQRAPVFAAVFTAELPSAAADLGHVAVGRGGRTCGRSPRRPTPADPRTGPRASHPSNIANGWLGMTWRLVDRSC